MKFERDQIVSDPKTIQSGISRVTTMLNGRVISIYRPNGTVEDHLDDIIEQLAPQPYKTDKCNKQRR